MRADGRVGWWTAKSALVFLLMPTGRLLGRAETRFGALMLGDFEVCGKRIGMEDF
jgi:hypothetical protein